MSLWVQDRAALRPFAWATPMRLLILLLIAATFLMEKLAVGNTDVSWLLTLGERWLDGERPYVDFIEVNPPASIMIYLPAVVLARTLGLAPEVVTTVMTVLAALVSLGLSGAILERAGLIAPARRDMLAAACVAMALLMPAGNFAEREHITVLAALPMLALLASRSVGVGATLPLALLAGVGGGIAMAIKPMFVLGFVGPVLFLLMRRGFRRTLSAWEIHAAWIVTGLYGFSVLIFFPGFTHEVLGWVLTAYVPVRCSMHELLTSPLTLGWVCFAGVATILMAQGRRNAGAAVLALSSVGFEAVFLMQVKDWAYQALPAALLMALAIALQLAEPQPAASRTLRLTRLAALPLTVVLCIQTIFMSNMSSVVEMVSPGLTAAIERLAPHPRLLTITMDMVVGHPLVRELEGRWVGSFSSNWLTTGLDLLDEAGGLTPQHKAELQALSDQEKTIVTNDIVTRTPDVILVQNSWWGRYVQSSPALEAAFAPYRSAGVYGPLTLWVRKPAP